MNFGNVKLIMKNGKYEEELARLCTYIHGRNTQLLRLALLGRAAGRTEDEVANEARERHARCGGLEDTLTFVRTVLKVSG